MNFSPIPKNTNWKKPHIIKVYEALTSIADHRIKITSPTTAKCYSSSGNKYYEIEFDKTLTSISSNDNSAYYTHTLSYPMIATLMLLGKISYNRALLIPLQGYRWKDINQKFKNNYDEAVNYTLAQLVVKNADLKFIKNEISKIYQNIIQLELKPLGKFRPPPNAY